MTDSTSSSSPVVANVRIMRALIAKDWRLYRLPVIGLIVAGVGAYFLAIGAESFSGWTFTLARILEDASFIALLLTALLASAFGGIGLAGERNERTAEFTALLPVTRNQIVTSKILVAGAVLLAFTLFYALLYFLFANADDDWTFRSVRENAVQLLECEIGCLLTLYGVAWLVSTFSTSAAISACVSIAVTAGMLASVSLRMHTRYDRGELGTEAAFYNELAITTSIVGLSCLIAGTIYYLRRVAS
jgi:ABC-type transport system involved in multi-copper enzyme maturation permease subunit